MHHGFLAALGIISGPKVFIAYDFTVDGTLPATFSVARASAATAQRSESTLLVYASNNTARWGRVLSSQKLATLIEPSRVNLYTRSNAGTGGELTAGSGTETITPGVTGPDGASSAFRAQVPSGGYVPGLLDGGTSIAGWAQFSMWVQQSTPGGLYEAHQLTTGTQGACVTGTTPASWTRVGSEMLRGGAANGQVRVCTGLNLSATGPNPLSHGPAAGARDCNIAWIQYEGGLWASEAIATAGTTATRAGEHLATSAIQASIAPSGQATWEFRFRPKAAITDGDSVGYLFYRDASNNASIDPATQRLTITIGGVAWTPVSQLWWDRGDTVNLVLQMGAGTRRALFELDDAGGGADLGVGPSDSAIAWSGSTDFLCNGTANQLACWLESITAYQ